MEVTSEITDIAQQLLQRYKDELVKTGHNSSGDLANTATFNVTFDGRYFEIVFNLQEYWKYLDNGTRPHFPPVSAIERWITVKRIVPKSIKGKVPSTKQLAYMIALSISKKGTPAAKVLRRTIDDSDDLINNLVDAITNQLQEEVNNEEV